MKKIALLLFVAMIIATNSFSQSKTSYVEVMYFHRTIRCKTCNSIEKITVDLINTEYSNELKSGNVTFNTINYEEDSTNLNVLKFAIEEPTLLIVFHTKKKDIKYDLTEVAFENALSSPAVLKKEIGDKLNEFFR